MTEPKRAESQPDTTLILFVTGNSPRSQRARDALRQTLAAEGHDPDGYREIDLLKQPECIVEYRVFAAPTLIHCVPGEETEVLYGDLTDPEKLIRLLRSC